MTPDILLITGIILTLLALTSSVRAWAHSDPFLTGPALFVCGICAIIYAVIAHPGGYAIRDIPDVVYEVVALIF